MAETYSTMLSLGTRAPDFDLPATDGQRISLADLKEAKALLVVFSCNHCPYAQAVEGRLIQIGHQWGETGLGMVVINSNDGAAYPEDSFENMKQRALDNKFSFPYCHDETQEVARAYRAACTPDPYLFDGEKRLVYRGQIDDNWRDPEKATRHDLREAIEATLAGRPVNAEQIAAMGCNIKWKH